MELKTKSALTEWANDQTMPEIAAYHNGLRGVKPVKKFESREVAVTRIWAVLVPTSPRWRGNPSDPQAGQSGRKQPKPKAWKTGATVRYEVVKLLSRADEVTLPELMKALKWQAPSVRASSASLHRSAASRSSHRKSTAFGRTRSNSQGWGILQPPGCFRLSDLRGGAYAGSSSRGFERGIVDSGAYFAILTACLNLIMRS
jgi:hypothetical protein